MSPRFPIWSRPGRWVCVPSTAAGRARAVVRLRLVIFLIVVVSVGGATLLGVDPVEALAVIGAASVVAAQIAARIIGPAGPPRTA